MKAIVTFVLVAGAAAATVEVIASIAEGRARRERMPLLNVVPDASLGYRPVPNQVHYGYELRTTLNALGLRGAMPEPGTPGTTVVVAGETQVYGIGIDDPDLLTARAAARLATRGRDTAFVNAGVRAYALGQQAELLERLVPQLRPEHVVVVVYPFAIRSWAAPESAPADPERHAWMLDLGGPTDAAKLARWHAVQLMRRSAALGWAWYRVKRWRTARGFWGGILAGPGDARAARAYEHARAAAAQIAALAGAHDARLWFVHLPPPEALQGETGTGFRDWVRATAAEHRAGFVDVGDALHALYEARGRLPTAPYDDHYDAEAHDAIASVLAERLFPAD